MRRVVRGIVGLAAGAALARAAWMIAPTLGWMLIGVVLVVVWGQLLDEPREPRIRLQRRDGSAHDHAPGGHNSFQG